MTQAIDVFTGGIAQTNGYLIEAPDGWVLFDAPEGVAAWLEQKGIKLQALVLTHQHYDHVMDAAKVAEAHGCPVYAHSDYHSTLTLEPMLRAAGMPVEVEPFEVENVLAGQSAVEVAGERFVLKFVPGHSADSMCFVSEGRQVVFSGDTVFAGSIGRTDLPGGSHPLLIHGIQTHLLTLADNFRFLPGHGPETSVGTEKTSNPYLR
ncbi:MBL fold metallo-hydrolase [Sulfuriroseicoccus oceanibius]|uniref:MBL fold metallo-hydrolase n=1 Tax=Sulfuriroseicoccus oceanibius TaxID=2707525 RepID=A0A6B3L9J6_9BACT|nr:MBL fold metallo-hydrolase [Sulfuriroseicoccus oceanibius]QQL44165.1 MBL fold metallo-hydrolase [Sulfuriroseicoccus oceanibius]